MDKKYAYGLLAIAVLFSLFFTTGYLEQGYPGGGDAVSHYDLLDNTISVIDTFMDTGKLRLWNSDYYFGFPMFFFYAPLPYVTLGLLSFLFGVGGLFFFKLSVVFLFSILPLCFYKALRLMEFDRLHAVSVAFFSSMLSSITVFGLEYYAFFATGLFSQLWGIVFLPFAFAYSYRYLVLKKGKPFYSVLFLVLCFTSHILVGFIAVLCFALLSMSVLLVHKNLKDWGKKVGVVAAFFLLATSFLLVPYFLHNDSFGNIPSDLPHKEEGYGFVALEYLFTAELLDYSFSFFRIPILTILFFVGLFFSFRSFRLKHPELFFFLLFGLGFSLFALIGEKTFLFISWIPLLSVFQTFRFITLFHFVALFYIGIALVQLYYFIALHYDKHKDKITLGKTTTFVIVLLLLSAPVFYERSQTFREYAVTHDLEADAAFASIVEAFNIGAPGRVYVTPASGLYSQPQQLQALPLLTAKDNVIGMGIGGHDSLTSYYASFFPTALTDLMAVNYVVDTKEGSPYPLLSSVPTGYFATVFAPFSVDATAVEARDLMTTWLFSHAARTGQYVLIGEADTSVRFSALENDPQFYTLTDDGNGQLRGDFALEAHSPLVTLLSGDIVRSQDYFSSYAHSHETKICGSIVEESQQRGLYTASVSASTDCIVLLKVSHHPEWRVFVNNVEQDLLMVSPSFMGVAVSPGEHTVMFSYEVFSYRIWLVILALISLVGAWFIRI